jgi:predicted GH43/DUF377 family glycosyl hydrolase
MTKFIWEKKGKIFDPNGMGPFMQNYAQNPNALELEDRVRVYFTTRPLKSPSDSFVSYTSFVDLNRNNLSEVIYVHTNPILPLGNAGDFDQFGIMPGSLVNVKEKNEIWLYYVGWTRMKAVPYNWSIGLAISKDGGKTFEKIGKGPIVGASMLEPYLQACPRVVRINEKKWYMWYQSGLRWNEYNKYMESVYVTMFATSEDGINWKRDAKQVIPSVVNEECQTSATVIELDNSYHMFFSYRHGINFRNFENGYRIGYANSADMMNWSRDDSKAGIEVSENGWDAEMICYPHVTRIGKKVVMFYCGNYFGKDGFGFAELKR